MANNIAVSITADVADLTAKLAIARAQVSTTTKSLNDLAKAANTNGMTTELKTGLLAAGDAAAKARSSAAMYTSDLKRLTEASNEAMHGSAGVTRELIVLGREAGRGNFSRMAGSATILAQRMGLLTPTVVGTAAAIAGMAAPIVAFAIAAEQGAAEAAKFQGAMEATNGYAGVTASQLQVMADKMSTFAHESIGAAKEQLAAIAASGKFSGETLELVGADAAKMSQLTGESSDKFVQQFEKMKDGVAKFAQEYQQNYHQLTAAQVEYIQKLEDQGRTEEAEHALAKDIYEYLGHQAPQNLGYLMSAWKNLSDTISEAWNNLKKFGAETHQDTISSLDERIAGVKKGLASAGGHDPGIQKHLADLEAERQGVQALETAEQKAAQGSSKSAYTQDAGIAAQGKLHKAFEESRASGEKLRSKIAEINQELAQAVAADPGHKAQYEQEAAAARAQAMKSDAPAEGKKPKAGPDVVSEWTEQLRAREVASNEFFKDQTADELKFWQEKLGAVTSGSKDWLAVQSKIYEAAKALAHQSYAEQIENFNEKLAADKNNWSQEKADWEAKLAFIRNKNGEISAEYKRAYREWITADREHNDQLVRSQDEADKRSVEGLKRNLDIARKARDDAAAADEMLIKGKAAAKPFGDISAEEQIGARKHQLIEQEIDDLDLLRAATSAQLSLAVARAQDAYGRESEEFKKAQADKASALAEFDTKQQEMEAKSRQQQIANIQAVQQAYHRYIDGTVSAGVSGFDGLISGQKTWAQAGIGIYQSVVKMAEQQFEKMAATWLIQHVFMTAAQRAQQAAQTGQTVASSAAQTTASVAASKTQAIALAGLAGAGGVASMAAAPFPLDLGAPAFGASMAAAATSLAAFDVGTNMLPSDMIAQVHAGERIIPAADNRQLMQMVQRGSAVLRGDTGHGSAGASGGGKGGNSGGGGDYHNHNWNISGMDSQSLKRTLMDHRGDIANALREHMRLGGA